MASVAARRDMLEEAVEVIRLLWHGGMQTHHGPHYTVEDARIYTLPETLPPIYVAAAGKVSGRLAGRIGDGPISVAPQPGLVEAYRGSGGEGKPTYGQLTVCWADDEEKARRTAMEWWPNAAISGELGHELPLPRHFEQAAQNVTEEKLAETVVCGPDPERHLEQIRQFAETGYDHVYVHQVGPDQEGFFGFYEEEVLPKVA